MPLTLARAELKLREFNAKAAAHPKATRYCEVHGFATTAEAPEACCNRRKEVKQVYADLNALVAWQRSVGA